MIKKHRSQPEAAEQTTFFDWVNFKLNQGDERFHMVYAVPNGGSRNVREAANLKRQGVRRGIPDIAFDYPSKGYHGLKIEMKAGKNKLTPEQKEYLKRYEASGYKTAVCYSFEEAKKTVEDYLR